MIEKQYKNYVSEIDLNSIVSQEGTTLLQAPTGGGKTYAIVKTFKDLSQKDKNKIYIIACPNRTQNIQNAEKYKIIGIVGGRRIKDTTIASMVYDKAKELKEYAIKENKEIVLVVDEAHQIIDSDFRKKALKQLEKLEGYSNNVVHVTATPRKIKDRFKYDYSYNLIPTETKHNIQNHFLIQLSDKDSISQLIEFLKKIKDGDMPYIALNDLKTIKLCQKILEKEGYRVGIASSETKDNDIFKNLEKEEKLPTKDYDFIFATSVLDCGVNFKNTDIKYINCILKSTQLDFDDTTQKISRPREQIKEAYTLVVEREERKIKCKKAIFKEIDFKLKKAQINYQKIFSNMIEILGYELALINMKAMLNLDVNKEVFYGSLAIEGEKIIIDKNKLIKKKYQEYDRQYYYNLKELNKKLKEVIKAENFKIAKIKDFSPDILKEDVKEISKEIEETKEDEKLQAKEILKDLDKTSQFLLEDFLLDNIELKEFPKDVQEKFKKLIDQETILKLLKKTIKENILIEDGIKLIVESEKDIEVKEYIKLHNYVMRNKTGTSFYTNDEYGVYRSVFDEVLCKRGRITNKKLQELFDELIDKKILKSKKNELSKANANKLLKTLEMIYNLTPKIVKDKEYFYISSLKKNI